MEYLNLGIITLAGILTSFFATISGGAALIYIPLLIFLGLPPSVAVATNRFSSLGAMASLYKFAKGGKIIYKLVLPLAFFATLGSFIGANLLLKIDEDLLQKIVAVLVILIALLIILKKDIGLERKVIQASKKRNILGYVLSFLIGIYAGFFGAAYATFFSYLLIFVFGLTVIESAGTRTMVGLFLVIAATIVFIVNGRVEFLYGGALLVGRAIGSYFGATFAIKHGEKYAKVIFIIFALAAGIKLLF
jgi:uncharacterized membrane protein YfcA